MPTASIQLAVFFYDKNTYDNYIEGRERADQPMPDIKLSDSELLKYAVENGIIDAALLQDKIEMQKRKEL